MSSSDRAARDRRIVAADERGEPVDVIRQREGLSERQVRRVIARARRQAEQALPVVVLAELDSSALVAEVIAVHRQVLDELAGLGRMQSPSSARVGAVKARATVSAQLLAIVQTVGLAPPSPVEWSVLRQTEALVRALVGVADRFGVDMAQVIEALDEDPKWAAIPTPLRRAA